MPHTVHRLAPLFFVALLALAAPGQKPADETPPEKPSTENPLFTLPEQRDSRNQLRAVLDYLGRTQIPWDVVTSTAQRLLDAKSDSFYRIQDAAQNDTGAVVSIKTKVNEILATLPADGKQFYEQEFGPVAANLLKQAVQSGHDRTVLTQVSQHYFNTKAGVQATVILAAADLAAGRYAEAAYNYRRVITRDDFDESPRVLFRGALALKRAGGDEKLAQSWADRAIQATPVGGIAFGRTVYSGDGLTTEFAHAQIAPTATVPGVEGRLANAARNGLSEAGAPLLEPDFVRSLVVPAVALTPEVPPAGAVAGAEWVRQKVALAIKNTDSSRGGLTITGFFPAVAPGMVIYRTYDGLAAVSTRDTPGKSAGELLWACGSTTDPAIGSAQSLFGADASRVVTEWWSGYWEKFAPQVLYDNSVLGSVSHDGTRAYYIQDLAVPPPPVGIRNNRGQPIAPNQNPSPGSPEARAESSRLAAINLATGRAEWVIGGPEAEPLTDAQEEAATSSTLLTAGAIFLGPPVAAGGRIYVVYEKRGRLRVACLDPANVSLSPGPNPVYEPKLLWTQLIGEPASPAVTDPLRRTQAAFLAVADGILVCPTNAGTVVALDLNAQRLLWARNYKIAAEDTSDPELGGIRRGRRLGRGVPPKPVPTERWRGAAPIIARGKVVVSAYDSDQILTLDLRTGEPLWSLPRSSDDVAVGGVLGETIVVVGRNQLKGLALNGEAGKPKQLWSVATGAPLGQGVAGRDGYFYLPVLAPSKVEAAGAQVLAVDAATGVIKPGVAFRRRTAPGADPRVDLGNLVFADGLMMSQSPYEIAAFPLAEPMRQIMEARLKANPNDPAAIVTRAELRLQDGDYAAAAADLRAARKFDPSDAVSRRLKQKLYTAYAELARKDFAAVEPHLAEYQQLCDVVADSPEPAERRQQLDEGAARQGLYLVQVATGREKQGQYAAAFEAYRAYAQTGDGSLVDIEGDPNGQTRPDLWARGRIERMAASGAKASAVITQKIDAEWAKVRESGDADELKAFAELFGGSGEAGRAAQLAYAELLAASTDPAEQTRAAELYSRVAATTELPTYAALCLDRLAKLALARGDTDTAAATYLKLAADYADTDLGDMTGRDRAAQALSDRRLLPSLDPGGVTALDYYKVRVAATTNNGRGQSPACELITEGVLAPAYRRFDLVAEYNTQDQSITVRAIDRATGEERAKFAGIGSTAGRQNNGVVFRGGRGNNTTPSISALADGSRLLLIHGNIAYCLDLATGREAWKLNLLGKSGPTAQIANNDTVESADGFTSKLHRVALLTPRYAALVTLEGLRVVDPATGADLWSRADVGKTATIFGDARHICIADNNDSRVLRPLDGSTVPGIDNFNAKVNGKVDGLSRLGFQGSRILLSVALEGKRKFSLYDPIVDKTIWSREFPLLNSSVIRTLDPAIAGILSGEGRFELFSTIDGKTLATGQVDAVALKVPESVLLEPLAILDAERVYLVVSRAGPNEGLNGFYHAPNAPTPRVLPVNGPLLAFDRQTGKRLWYNLDSLLLQRLIVERFTESPVLLAAGSTRDDGGTQRMAVVLIDKRTGRLRYDVKQNLTSDFTNVTVEPRTREVVISRPDLTIRLTPSEGPNP